VPYYPQICRDESSTQEADAEEHYGADECSETCGDFTARCLVGNDVKKTIPIGHQNCSVFQRLKHCVSQITKSRSRLRDKFSEKSWTSDDDLDFFELGVMHRFCT